MPLSRRTRRKIARRARRRGPPARISLALIVVLAIVAVVIALARALP